MFVNTRLVPVILATCIYRCPLDVKHAESRLHSQASTLASCVSDLANCRQSWSAAAVQVDNPSSRRVHSAIVRPHRSQPVNENRVGKVDINGQVGHFPIDVHVILDPALTHLVIRRIGHRSPSNLQSVAGQPLDIDPVDRGVP